MGGRQGPRPDPRAALRDGVFEGIRCYDTEIGPAVFRHKEHIDRLYKSSELYYMPVPFEAEQVRQARSS